MCTWTTPREQSFGLHNGVAIYGGFAGTEALRSQRDVSANVTILSGDINGDDSSVACTQQTDCDSLGYFCVGGSCIIANNGAENSYHVVSSNNAGPTTVLDGFTITGGNANGSSPLDSGAGMYSSGGGPTIANCIFSGNFAVFGGGMRNFFGSPTLSNCVFDRNSASDTAGGLETDGSATLMDCTFSSNYGYFGAGMAVFANGGVAATNCTFSGNFSVGSGGGLYIDGSNPMLNRCKFYGNIAFEGGGVKNVNNANGTLANCDFSGNGAGTGGGMLNDASNPSLINCTLSRNFVSSLGGGIYNNGTGNPTLTNCILWGNSDVTGTSASAQLHTNGGAPVVNYSIVQGGWAGAGGTGNGSTDPLFLDDDGLDNVVGTLDDNLRLRAGSPAIDAGNNAAVTGTTDLDGNPRIIDGNGDLTATVDKGAYEYFTDCNFNGIADALDILNGTSQDLDLNGIPDQCGQFTGGCTPNNNWSCFNNWDLPGNFYPDDVASASGIFVTLGNGDHPFLDVDATIPGMKVGVGAILNITQSGSPGDLSINSDRGLIVEGFPLSPDPLARGQINLSGNRTMTISSGTSRSYGDILVQDNSLIEVQSGTFFIDGNGIYKAAAGGAHSILRVGTADCCDSLTCTCKLASNGPPYTPTIELSGQMSIEVNGDFSNQGVVHVADAPTISITNGAFLVRASGIYERNPSAIGVTSASLVADTIRIEPGVVTPFVLDGGQVTLSDSMTMQSFGAVELIGDPMAAGAEARGGHTPPKLSILGGGRLTVGGTLSMSGVAGSINSSSQGVVLGGDFANHLLDPSLFDWSTGLFSLNGGVPQDFEVAATDVGALLDPATAQYVIGDLQIISGAIVTFHDSFDNDSAGQGPCTEALYVHTLELDAGSFITLDNCRVYYETLVRDPSATVSTIGCGEFVQACPLAQPAAPEPNAIAKNRYISFLPSNSGIRTALRVTMVSLQHPDPPNLPQFPPQNFAALEGHVRWIGSPGNCTETESPPATFKCASLQCAPQYLDWPAATSGQTLHVNGAAIMPSSIYKVEAIAQTCDLSEPLSYSVPLTITTARWGDVAAPFQAPAPAALTQPNIGDIAAIVDKFKAVPTAIILARADLNPGIPNNRVDISDVASCVDAFKNIQYLFAGPQACP